MAGSASVAENIKTRPLSPAIGAEIIGVDLSQPTDAETKQKMLDIWHDNLVILIRDQNLDEDSHVRFADNFGEPARSARAALSVRSTRLSC